MSHDKATVIHHRKGRQTPNPSFLIDAWQMLEDCQTSIRKAQRISRGEIGELAIGYISALTHDFLGKALEIWRLNSSLGLPVHPERQRVA